MDGWPLDIDEALKSGLFISGTSGSGKTNLAKLIAQRLMNEGVTVYVFDPSQAWHDSPIPQIIKVGAYDATRIFEGSTVYDISLMYVQQQREYVERFCRELFQQRVCDLQSRSPIFLVFEEAQLYLPEGGSRSKAFQELYRIITVGRNYNIRYMLITQFAALVDKTCVKMTKQRYFGYSDELNDVRYIANFIDIEAHKLVILKIGEFLYDYGKQTKLIHTPPYHTREKPNFIKPVSQPENPAWTAGAIVKGQPTNQKSWENAARNLIMIFWLIIFLILLAIIRH